MTLIKFLFWFNAVLALINFGIFVAAGGGEFNLFAGMFGVGAATFLYFSSEEN